MDTRKFFEGKERLISWAPYRIDAGGTWDIKALALPFQSQNPVTLNAALGLGVEVELLPYKRGFILIRSSHYPELGGPLETVSFRGPLGLFAMCLKYFDLDGVSVTIRPSLPPGSALGGSSSALIALLVSIKALLNLEMEDEKLVTLAYHLEDIHQSGGAGMQDHLAAFYGGVHLWRWRYGSYPFFEGEELSMVAFEELRKRVLVAYVGSSHFSPGLNKAYISEFMEGTKRKLWLKANEIVGDLWHAIKDQNWKEAASLLKQETQLRKEITPDAFKDPFLNELIQRAEEYGCGARFTGAGGGGCVWALGDIDQIEHLKDGWKSLMSKEEGAFVLHTTIGKEGAWVKVY